MNVIGNVSNDHKSNYETNLLNEHEDIIPTAQTSADEDERPSCKYGGKCVRQNPRHRLDMAHPGDEDYVLPSMPAPNKDAKKCKYGRKCYRLNPEHFKSFTHPRNINIQQNYKKYIKKCQRNGINRDSSFDYNVSDDDPFAGDSDGSDYFPSEDE